MKILGKSKGRTIADINLLLYLDLKQKRCTDGRIAPLKVLLH